MSDFPASRVRPSTTARATRYSARDGAIIGHNQGGWFNRPIYLANAPAFVLAGDRPLLRFASGDTLHGTFSLGVVRGARSRWLHDFSDLTLEYRPSHAAWLARDPAFPGLELRLETVGAERGVAFSVRLTVIRARPSDRLIWCYGGAHVWPKTNLNWELDPHKNPPYLPKPLDPAHCQRNRARLVAGGFLLSPARASSSVTSGQCDARSPARLGDAAHWAQPSKLRTSSARTQPVVSGDIDPAAESLVHWQFTRLKSAASPRRRAGDPAKAFAGGLRRSAALAGRLLVETPEPRLNAAAAAAAAAIDGVWYAPVFRHGAMLWNRAYPGWRTVFGGTVLGWHDRVKAQAKFYAGHQVTVTQRRALTMDPKTMLTLPAKSSRFYGRGRILGGQGVYNMQSQFFDQLIHAWRWTGDADLAARLRPALELHLEWLKDCFDPDDDGLYESFVNVWPTDSVWFAGGGATEETAYAFRAHTAAEQLARHAGDAPSATRHARQAARIRSAFHRKLWMSSKGHAGLYCEQHGEQRLHPDAWLYSIFLPIDAGLLDPLQTATSLRFTETGLQNDGMPFGGRQVWTSNFVPAIWSVRERWAGDNHHLALAYFQAGLAADGWDIFRGTFLHTAFDSHVPGDLGAPAGGTDFGDSTHMFARTLVEGLFGFAPDRPNGVVRIAPQFPATWKHARLQTPDVHLRYARTATDLTLEVDLTRPSRLEITLPVTARGIAGVSVNGRPTSWKAEPGFGRTLVRLNLRSTRRAMITLKVGGALRAPQIARGAHGPPQLAVQLSAQTGKRMVLRSPAGPIVSFVDPQDVLADAKLRRGTLTGRLTANVGHHTVFARVQPGTLPRWERFQIHVSDPVAERAASAQRPTRVPARANWQCVDLAPALNGDIRTIYTQKYLSPRPATISARLGSDGYTPWTFVYWNSFPPVIKLDGVPALLRGAAPNQLRTPQGVPFAWPGDARNVAFTSRWDNWPESVTVPVGCAGDAAWFLVCGSTNPMQGHVANAVLHLRYVDGVVEDLELIPPVNYWNLSPIKPEIAAPGQDSRFDYTAPTDAFCVPKVWPQTVQLGENCRAMVLGWRLRPGVILREVTLQTLSAEVVVGLMGLSVMNPRP
jgi:hypothetical protein